MRIILSIVIFLLIVGGAIVLRTGVWRKWKKEEKTAGEEKKPGEKTPYKRERHAASPALNAIGIAAIVFAIAAGIWGFNQLGHALGWWNKEVITIKGWAYPTTQPASPPPAPDTEVREALILEKECVTPCSVKITFRFKIRTDGDPLWIRYPCVDTLVPHPGKGEGKVPPEMCSGETFLTSRDSANPHVRTWTYRKEKIRSKGA